ncbi:MAG: hypothetical protein P4M15_09500 [Alphaproteobacteria bacterium]|nr:hypothetical protein [Alphaproteobacteria bacterium]
MTKLIYPYRIVRAGYTDGRASTLAEAKRIPGAKMIYRLSDHRKWVKIDGVWKDARK